MANKRLVWDEIGEHFYETGVSQVALYPYNPSTKKYGAGVAWSGVTAISETPSGAEASDLYADDQKYLSLYSAEELGASIEAYQFPDEFMACDGTKVLANGGVFIGQQERLMFALAYITRKGNDVVGNEYGRKLHIIYGCKASPSERAYNTINDSPEAITFSWELTTQKVSFVNTADGKTYKVSNITVDETAMSDFNNGSSALFEGYLDTLFGTDPNETAGTTGSEPTLMMPTDFLPSGDDDDDEDAAG